jgi:hypothetical protein
MHPHDDTLIDAADRAERLDRRAGAILMAASAILTLALATCALAHEAPSGWRYDGDCCSSLDCAELPPGAVTLEGSAGYRVRLAPGQHPMAPAGGEWLVPHDRRMTSHSAAPAIRPSGDEHYHGCILGGALRCLYVPHGGA